MTTPSTYPDLWPRPAQAPPSAVTEMNRLFELSVKQSTELAAKDARIEQLERERAEMTLRLDNVMLEYCPDEMSAEQIENWASRQQAVSPERQAEFDAICPRKDHP